MRNYSYQNVFTLQVHFHANQTDFHIKRFSQRLVLRQRHKRIGNSPLKFEVVFAYLKFPRAFILVLIIIVVVTVIITIIVITHLCSMARQDVHYCLPFLSTMSRSFGFALSHDDHLMPLYHKANKNRLFCFVRFHFVAR